MWILGIGPNQSMDKEGRLTPGDGSTRPEDGLRRPAPSQQGTLDGAEHRVIPHHHEAVTADSGLRIPLEAPAVMTRKRMGNAVGTEMPPQRSSCEMADAGKPSESDVAAPTPEAEIR